MTQTTPASSSMSAAQLVIGRVVRRLIRGLLRQQTTRPASSVPEDVPDVRYPVNAVALISALTTPRGHDSSVLAPEAIWAARRRCVALG
jgi:hypothetical protein